MFSVKKNDYYYIVSKYEHTSVKNQQKDDNRERIYKLESAMRAKNVIIDYALNNNFNFFATITVDKKNMNRYDYKYVTKKLRQYLNNYKKRNDPQLKYLLVPEKHKDGAIHYHGLFYFSRIGIDVLTYLHQKSTKATIESSQAGFNHEIKIFRHKEIANKFGVMNEFTRIYNRQEFIAYYMSKYITKDVSMFTGQHYYCSKGLERSEIILSNKDILSTPQKLVDYKGQFATKWRLTEEQYLEWLNDNIRQGLIDPIQDMTD